MEIVNRRLLAVSILNRVARSKRQRAAGDASQPISMIANLNIPDHHLFAYVRGHGYRLYRPFRYRPQVICIDLDSHRDIFRQIGIACGSD